MFGRLMIGPFLLLALVGFYLSWEYSESWNWLIILGILGGAVVYIFGPQINWWYYRKYPPDVDPEARFLLEQGDIYYQELSPVQRKKFRQRVALFIMNNSFEGKGWETVPHEVEVLLAAAASKLLYHQEYPLFKLCQKVIVYPGTFPSPDYPEEWHRSEWHEEDGVMLISGEYLLKNFKQTHKNPDLALYEYIRVMRQERADLPWPQLPDEPWGLIHQISGWTREGFISIQGLKHPDVKAVMALLYFSHPHKMDALPGEWMEKYSRVFGPNSWRRS
jgi:hypothetical protein